MIEIQKPAQAPQKLLDAGQQETERVKALYEADSAAYQNGTKKFKFQSSIYGHPSVKTALRNAQHNKCCFCERKTEVGHIEHYRSKGGYKQQDNDVLAKLGYYWLAYDWDNLLFSCETCNSSYKRNFFPLENPDKRAICHSDDISQEKPLIIHPAKENPEQFIEFIGFQPRAIGGNEKGKETIKRVGLNRPFIDERRRDFYESMKEIYRLSEDTAIPLDKRQALKKLLDDASRSEREYSSMIRCALKNNFRF